MMHKNKDQQLNEITKDPANEFTLEQISYMMDNFDSFVELLNHSSLIHDINSIAVTDKHLQLKFQIIGKLFRKLSNKINSLLNGEVFQSENSSFEVLSSSIKLFLDLVTSIKQVNFPNDFEIPNIDFWASCPQDMPLKLAEYLGKIEERLSQTQIMLLHFLRVILCPPFSSKDNISKSSYFLFGISEKMLDDHPELLRFYTRIFMLLPLSMVEISCQDRVEEIKTRLESILDSSILAISSELLEFITTVCFSNKFQNAIVEAKIHEVLYQKLINTYCAIDLYCEPKAKRNKEFVVQILLNCFSSLEEEKLSKFIEDLFRHLGKLQDENPKLAFRDEVLIPIIHGENLSDYIPICFKFGDKYYQSISGSAFEKLSDHSAEGLLGLAEKELIANQILHPCYKTKEPLSKSRTFHIEWQKVIHSQEEDIQEADCVLMLIQTCIDGRDIKFGVYLDSGFEFCSWSSTDKQNSFLFYITPDKRLHYLCNQISVSKQTVSRHISNKKYANVDLLSISNKSNVLLKLDNYNLLEVNYPLISQYLDHCKDDALWMEGKKAFYGSYGSCLQIYTGYRSFKIDKLHESNSVYCLSNHINTIIRNLEYAKPDTEVFLVKKDLPLQNIIEIAFRKKDLDKALKIMTNGIPLEITLENFILLTQNKNSTKIVELTIEPCNLAILKIIKTSPELVFHQQVQESFNNGRNPIIRSLIKYNQIKTCQNYSYTNDILFDLERKLQIDSELNAFKELLDLLIGETKFFALYLHSILSGLSAREAIRLLFSSLLRELTEADLSYLNSKEISDFLKKATIIIFEDKKFKKRIEKLTVYLKNSSNFDFEEHQTFLTVFVSVLSGKRTWAELECIMDPAINFY